MALVAAHHQAAALLAEVDEQVGVAQGRQMVSSPAARSRNGWVTRYSWANGTTGTRTPASRPSSAANIPPALTTISASISPHSVLHAADPAVADVDVAHARVGEDLAAALAGAVDSA